MNSIFNIILDKERRRVINYEYIKTRLNCNSLLKVFC